MDHSDILTLVPRRLKKPKSSKLNSKAKGGGLSPHQVKILVAVLAVIFGCMLVAFVGVVAWEYRKASKHRAETNTPINTKCILKEAGLTVLTFGMKRIGWKEKENKDVERLNQGAEDGQKVGDASRNTAIS